MTPSFFISTLCFSFILNALFRFAGFNKWQVMLMIVVFAVGYRFLWSHVKGE